MKKPNTHNASCPAAEDSADGVRSWLAPLKVAFENFPAARTLTAADIREASPPELLTACIFLHEMLADTVEALQAIGDNATCSVAFLASGLASQFSCCGGDGLSGCYFGYDTDAMGQSGNGDEEGLSPEEEEEVARREQEVVFNCLVEMMTPDGAAAYAKRVAKYR